MKPHKIPITMLERIMRHQRCHEFNMELYNSISMPAKITGNCN